MSYELNVENIIINKPLKPSLLKSVLNTDVIVPDTKPDVAKILQVNALSSVSEKYVQKDMITVSGFVDYTILYCADDETNEIKNIKFKAPFSQQIEANGIEQNSNNYVLSDVSHIEYDICNSRKISLKSVISFETGIVGKTNVDSVSAISSTINIPCIEKEIDVLNMTVCQESKFEITDEINLGYSFETEPEVLKVDSRIIPEEHKTMNGKVVVKGILDTDVLYLRDGDICHIENQTPFTEVIDVNNLSPHMHTEIKYGINSCECDFFQNDDTGFSLKTDVNFIICGYEQTEHKILTDAYCPDYCFDIMYNNLDYFSVDDSFEKNFTVTANIELDEKEPPILKVYNLNAKPVIETVSPGDGYCVIDGYVDTKILYLSDDETRIVYSAAKKIPFSQKTEMKCINSSSKCNAEISMDNVGYIIKSENIIEIRASIKLSMMILKEQEINVISSISIDEEKPVIKDNISGITIYFADDSEKLWDVAKKYSTTVEEIIKANNLDEGSTLSKGQRLMIPKRVNTL